RTLCVVRVGVRDCARDVRAQADVPRPKRFTVNRPAKLCPPCDWHQFLIQEFFAQFLQALLSIRDSSTAIALCTELFLCIWNAFIFPIAGWCPSAPGVAGDN